MKKTVLPALLALALFLTACGAKADEAEKARAYEILDAEGVSLYTVTDAEAVARIDSLLTSFTSGQGALAQGGAPEALYTYVCYQEVTIQAGEDLSADRDWIEVLRLTIPAEGTQVTLQALAEGTDALSELVPQLDLGELLTFTYDAGMDTADALRDPGQFAA